MENWIRETWENHRKERNEPTNEYETMKKRERESGRELTRIIELNHLNSEYVWILYMAYGATSFCLSRRKNTGIPLNATVDALHGSAVRFPNRREKKMEIIYYLLSFASFIGRWLSRKFIYKKKIDCVERRKQTISVVKIRTGKIEIWPFGTKKFLFWWV